jgi:hypothetical protein
MWSWTAVSRPHGFANGYWMISGYPFFRTKDQWEKMVSFVHTKLYDQRKETIERVFADAKEKHAMRYTQYRGLSQVRKWVRLKFAAMNLKKFAKHRWNALHSSVIAFLFPQFYFSAFLSA